MLLQEMLQPFIVVFKPEPWEQSSISTCEVLLILD